MWFAFGFITLFSFSLYFLINRFQKNWDANSLYHKSRHYIRGTKSFEKGFYIGCVGNNSLSVDFSIKKESFIDRFFKKVGIAIECQVDNKEFDDNFYIITDNEQLCTYLKNQSKFQNEISIILKICKKNDLKFEGFFFKGNRLWVHILKDKEEPIHELLPHLFNLIDIFNTDSKEIRRIKTSDKFIIKAGIILAINTAIVIASMGLVIFLNFSSRGFIIENWGLIKLSIFISGIIVLIFTLIVLNILGKSSRTHLVIFEILTLGFLGFSFGTYSVLNKININYDTSIPDTFIARLVKKDVVHSTRGGVSKYYFYIRKSHGGIKKIRVTSDLYRKFNKKEIVKVYIKKGLFHFEWVSNVKKATLTEKSKTRIMSEPKIVTINNERVLIYKDNNEYVKKLREKIKALDLVYQKGMTSFRNKDYNNAMNYFQKGIEKDYSKSFQMIGFMYMQGKGVEKSQEEAVKWFKRANESSMRVNKKDK